MYGHNLKVYADRFGAFGFNTITIDGHSIKEIIEGLAKAKKEQEKPTVIICKTIKGKGYCDKV